MNATKVTKSIPVNDSLLNENLDKCNPSECGISEPIVKVTNSGNREYHIINIDNPCYKRERCFLYLFPGEGNDYEWEFCGCGYITHLMAYLIKYGNLQHPSMTIVMPKIYYDNSDKVAQAQKITDYIKYIVDDVEGYGSWDNADTYRKRAVAGLCLGGLCAMKCALYWEKPIMENPEKFFSLGVFSPANGAENGHWLNGRPNFKFNVPTHHYLYISCGNKDGRWNLTKVYVQNFENNHSPVSDFVRIEDGIHNWDSFRTGFADFMQYKIFDSKFYFQNENRKNDIGRSRQQ